VSWKTINLKDVPTQPPVVPVGKYTFELTPGAKYNEAGALLAAGRIASDGEFTGRLVFFSYPDPESIDRGGKPNTWSATALKRLEVALGVDQQEGEDMAEFLNRAAGNKFGAKVTHSPVTDEYPTPRVSIGLFSVEPAA